MRRWGVHPGWVVAAVTFAVPGAGAIRKVLGEYQLAFILSGGLCLVAALLSLAGGHRSARWWLPKVELLEGLASSLGEALTMAGPAAPRSNMRGGIR
jgi:hypothetical protein